MSTVLYKPSVVYIHSCDFIFYNQQAQRNKTLEADRGEASGVQGQRGRRGPAGPGRGEIIWPQEQGRPVQVIVPEVPNDKKPQLCST